MNWSSASWGREWSVRQAARQGRALTGRCRDGHRLPTGPRLTLAVVSDLGDIAQVASTMFAAGAAGAAWASVRQGQRVWRASIEPDLHLQILMDMQNDETHIVITNTGGGTAKGSAVTIVAGTKKAAAWVGDGFIAPGDKVLVSVRMPVVEHAEAVALYRTRDESSWVRAADGRTERLRKGHPGEITNADEGFRRMYPDTPLEELHSASAQRVEWVERRGVQVARRPDVPGL